MTPSSLSGDVSQADGNVDDAYNNNVNEDDAYHGNINVAIDDANAENIDDAYDSNIDNGYDGNEDGTINDNEHKKAPLKLTMILTMTLCSLQTTM